MNHIFSPRDKLILAGLYLSKFDRRGLDRLGFSGFHEAFNSIAYGLGARPASLKNYRDEFDPLFPNPRKGWHKRPTREYCKRFFERFGNLNLTAFTNLILSLILNVASPDLLEPRGESSDNGVDEESSFAKRLITGIAAEGYFERVFPALEVFKGGRFTNTTRFGCGFDYKIEVSESEPFMAVEVKGLRSPEGTISLTDKEHCVAERLGCRYFLFVARNFAEQPFHSLYRNPVACGLDLIRVERKVISTTWSVRIPSE